jgi:hypothetical protein
MTTIKIVNYEGPLQDCECCGSYHATGISVYVENQEVWFRYSDGHMDGDESEHSLVDGVLDTWYDVTVQRIENNYTEAKRHEWNANYPGNTIAATPESWKNELDDHIEMFNSDFDEVKKECWNMPHSIVLACKMIALWIENFTSEVIDVIEENNVDFEQD